MPIAEASFSTPSGAVWALVVSVLGVVGTLFVTFVVLVRLPPGAFLETRRDWPRTIRGRILRILLNVLGWALILLGAVLAVPGVPGQGLLTILLGLLLVDFPGRRKLLRAILSRPAVRRGVDRIRIRFGRPPFIW